MQDPPLQSSDTLERLEEAERLKLMGHHKEALEILEKILIEDPENIAALEEVADNELSMEQFDRAEAAAQQAVTLDTESYTGHYILGFITSHNEKWDDALSHLKRANALKPNNPEILRCLGWVLFSADQRAQGVVTLERALNLDNENPLTLCDLGVAYLQTQNFPKAKALLVRALEIEPENERARDCVQAIERLEEQIKK